ncbi:hypothetical protein THRCLA_05635 [Thraustotheca clavata]|uniref:Uncharacterized protein n=1 Tax=Thraustotheca clavata TaxID=74557 RepID=A0A1V9ZVD8_9STRA|nr:hypothetical protein THRCLA_05635 [Thraustotheca clavata]
MAETLPLLPPRAVRGPPTPHEHRIHIPLDLQDAEILSPPRRIIRVSSHPHKLRSPARSHHEHQELEHHDSTDSTDSTGSEHQLSRQLSKPKQRWVHAVRKVQQASPSHRWIDAIQRLKGKRTAFVARPAAHAKKDAAAFSLSDIDRFLGRTKPPAIEYLVVEVLVSRNPCHPSQLGRWAHSAVRYTLPDGQQKLVNICRPGDGRELIEFFDDPEDYILGVQGKGGIFSRDICSVRIEEVNPASMMALHHHFLATSHRFRADGNGVKFEITGGFWHNLFRELFHLPSRPSGNCAKWVSKGLVYANVLRRQSMFPKAIWVEMIESQTVTNPQNVNVVYYRRIHAKEKEKPHLKTGFSFTSIKAVLCFPADMIQSWIYWDMKQYANVIVENSKDLTIEAQSQCLKCELVKGPGRRVHHWIVYFLRFLHLLIVAGASLTYIFYCPHGFKTQYLDENFSYTVCPSSWPILTKPTTNLEQCTMTRFYFLTLLCRVTNFTLFLWRAMEPVLNQVFGLQDILGLVFSFQNGLSKHLHPFLGFKPIEWQISILDRRYSILVSDFNSVLIEWMKDHAYTCFSALFKMNQNMAVLVFETAIYFGHLPLLEYLYTKWREFAISPRAMDIAALCGKLPALKFLHFHDFGGCSSVAMDCAARFGHIDIVNFLHHYRTEGCTEAAMNWAACSGYYEIVLFLHFNRKEGCTKEALNWAACHGHLNIVRFLHDNRLEGCTQYAIDWASRNGHLDIVDFLHHHRTEGCTEWAMTWAATEGRLDVVKYLMENRTEGCCEHTLNWVAAKGNIDMALFLLQHKYPGSRQSAIKHAARTGQLQMVKILYAPDLDISEAYFAAGVHGHNAVTQFLAPLMYLDGCDTSENLLARSTAKLVDI